MHLTEDSPTQTCSAVQLDCMHSFANMMVAKNELELCAHVLHMYGGVTHVLELIVLKKLLLINLLADICFWFLPFL